MPRGARLNQRVKEWWSGGGFITVATILVTAGITWGSTLATIRNDQSDVAKGLDSLGKQLEEVKREISGVRSAQDGVLKLQGEVDALRQRLTALESASTNETATQTQINRVTSADIARLQAEVNYLGRK